MATKFSEVKERVKELGDGRTFTDTQQASWANSVRKSIAQNYEIVGFNGLYFLFKEATVKGGSVKDQARYAIPTDYISHLNVFYDDVCLTDGPPKSFSQVRDLTETGTPEWVRMMGLEFELIPIPDKKGDPIKLLFHGFASNIPTSSNDDTTDFFLDHWPDLHIFGMGKLACQSIGKITMARECGNDYMREQKALQIHNRQHWIGNARVRYTNWDEYQDFKRLVFPQLTET